MVTHALSNTDTITITNGESDANKVAVVSEFSGQSGTPIDKSSTNTNKAPLSNTLSCTATSTVSINDELILGVFGAYKDTSTSFTLNPGSGYTSANEAIITNSVISTRCYMEYKSVNITPTTYAPSCTTSLIGLDPTEYAAICLTYENSIHHRPPAVNFQNPGVL
jgi:hypothetical protein